MRLMLKTFKKSNLSRLISIQFFRIFISDKNRIINDYSNHYRKLMIYE